MKIENTIKIIFGSIVLTIGIILIFKVGIIGLIYGSILIILGFAFIIFSKSEQKIEQRKDINNQENNE